MSYTPTTWTTGDTITATAMNKIENGIAGAVPWDAVIRLTHANNSGQDIPANLTPSIVSGTFSDLYNKASNGGCPCVLVEYVHPWGMQYAAPMAYLYYPGANGISFIVAGFSTITNTFIYIGTLIWADDNTVFWD